MLLNSQFDQIRQIFADQFSTDARGCVFRKGQKGPPIRVSEVERDQLIAAFERRIRYGTWSIVPITLGMILLLVWLIPVSDAPIPQSGIWAVTAAIIVPLTVTLCWAWNAPSRALVRRTPEGSALTKEEARALAFSQITYGNLILAGFTGVGLVLMKSIETDVSHGWGIIWLVFGIAVISFAGIQALRKWHHSRR